MSVMRPDTVGSEPRSSRVIAVAAPVWLVLNTGSDWPTTVIVSATAATFSLKLRSVVVPRLTVTSPSVSPVNPVSEAVTLYGPPTRTPAMKNRPSACVTPS